MKLSEEKKNDNGQISRRQFLKDAGLIVGGATLGSVALVNACGGTTTVTAPGVTSTKTVTSTSTTTVAGPGGSVITVTQTAPGTTATVTATKTVSTTAAPAAQTAEGESLVYMNINGVNRGLVVKNHQSLAEVLREQLGLFALKEGCQLGECGACTVTVDDRAVYSCLLLACEMGGRKVMTVEGLSNNGVLGPVQQKFYDQDVAQCGYCTPGFIMATEALWKATPKPTLDEVREALGGHVCMCGNVHRHVTAAVGGA
jgi:aerobic-type carbon monoxide dehydrogenase small subunit (CoxS/CutS family)